MPHRIEIAFQPGVRDSHGEKIARRIRSELDLLVQGVRCVDIYTVDAKLEASQLQLIAGSPLSDPVIQVSSVDAPIALDVEFDWAVEVALLPGVTDNVGRTAREAISLALRRPFTQQEGVYTSRQYLLRGTLTAASVDRIASLLLANSLIQRWTILDKTDFRSKAGFAVAVPKVIASGRQAVEPISLMGSDQALQDLSRQRVLALSLMEMKAIRDYFGQESVRAARTAEGLGPSPSDVEIETLAQTWSEHCKHKIFNALICYRENGGAPQIVDSLFDAYIRGTTDRVRQSKGSHDLCLSVFVDNAGVIRFNEQWSLVYKVETHNSPSALDPYGGALTGIVGVNRDPLGTGQGSRLIFNTDVFCFASPFWKEPLPTGLLHPRRILEGVREGVEHGGNKSGIPTINGSVVFEDRFLGKPLVFCGTAGLLPASLHGRPGHEKKAQPGDRIVMVGGRIGKDGIHGATFSSEELHQGSPVSAVQIGDPITQKRMSDFLLRARDLDLYSCMTDDGAGGLSSSVGEMARDTGGCDLDLTQAPLKYAGLAPWEILLSEAQERMTLAVSPSQLPRLLQLAERYQVEATDLGAFTESGWFRVLDQGRTVALMSMDFLHDGLPRLELEARWEQPAFSEFTPNPLPSQGKMLRLMLARLNICSKAYWVRQYDHEVQAGTVLKPLVGAQNDGPSDASVFRPLQDSMEAVVVSHGLCPRYSDVDAYAMAACTVDEAVRNAVAVGADPDRLAGLDNFCWCDPVRTTANPDGDFKLGQLVRAARGLHQVCLEYGIPLISGKDSMKNDAVVEGKRISIAPTLLFSLLGKLDDARLAVSMDAKRPGDWVYVAGITRKELAASEFQLQLQGQGGRIPQVRPAESLPLYRAIHRAMMAGCVASCHDCSDGGLGVCLAETAFAGGFGLSVDLRQVPTEDVDQDEQVLYSESPGRLVITVAQDKTAAFERHVQGLSCARVGEVLAKPILSIHGLSGKEILSEPLQALKDAWLAPLNF